MLGVPAGMEVVHTAALSNLPSPPQAGERGWGEGDGLRCIDFRAHKASHPQSLSPRGEERSGRHRICGPWDVGELTGLRVASLPRPTPGDSAAAGYGTRTLYALEVASCT